MKDRNANDLVNVGDFNFTWIASFDVWNYHFSVRPIFLPSCPGYQTLIALRSNDQKHWVFLLAHWIEKIVLRKALIKILFGDAAQIAYGYTIAIPKVGVPGLIERKLEFSVGVVFDPSVGNYSCERGRSSHMKYALSEAWQELRLEFNLL